MGSKLAFEEGERVVYPNHGMCIVENIRKETIGGISDTFYNVRILETGSSLFIPSGNLQTVGIRYPIKKSEVKKFFARIDNGEINVFSKWKNRYEENVRLMSTGTLGNMIDVLKSLFYVSSKKNLSFREKKMLEKALSLVSEEIAHSMNENRSTVESQLVVAFEKAIEKFEKQQH